MAATLGSDKSKKGKKVTDLVLDEVLDDSFTDSIGNDKTVDLHITQMRNSKRMVSSISSKHVTKRVRTAVRRPKLNEAEKMLKLAHETNRDSQEAETAATSKGHHKGKSAGPMSFWTSDAK